MATNVFDALIAVVLRNDTTAKLRRTLKNPYGDRKWKCYAYAELVWRQHKNKTT